MPRSFDLSASFERTVEDVRAAFSAQEYWLARLAVSRADTATLDTMTVDDDGTVAVTTTQGLRRDRLPAMVTQFHRGDLEIVRRETWAPVGAGAARADISCAVQAAPVTLVGTGALGPAGGGSRLTYTATVEVRIPLVGGKIETFIGGKLAELVAAEQHFTTVWINGNGATRGQ